MDYTLPLCGLRSSKQCKLKNGENKEWRRRSKGGCLNATHVDHTLPVWLAAIQEREQRDGEKRTGYNVYMLCNGCRSQVKWDAGLCCCSALRREVKARVKWQQTAAVAQWRNNILKVDHLGFVNRMELHEQKDVGNVWREILVIYSDPPCMVGVSTMDSTFKGLCIALDGCLD